MAEESKGAWKETKISCPKFLKVWDNMRDIFPHPYTLKDALQFIDIVSAEDPQLTFAIEYNGHFAGMISLIKQPEVYRKSAEPGFWIGERK
ncbi:hypothetical protein EK417_10550 [Chryseobacterium candidae]|uniref:N-acetyltransferase domain-containing protein n=2 Tax=Chryseobacterium group TaxID=2782232 RepID=A0ABY2R729_9FLAO|nr:hypothetical protein EK417_10550 [Chryseobacterium candidae]